MFTSKKELNLKKGRVNDNWHHWVVIEGAKHAFVKFTDSLIKESILADRKIDCQDIRHEVVLVYMRPWTGFKDNITENTSNYISFVKKAYWEGRIDQFVIAELIPGKDPIIHDFDRATMYQKAKELEVAMGK